MTESININSFAYHHIWSTIKTLPSTLPEPSSMDHGSRSGVTGAVSASDLDVYWRVGADTWGLVLWPWTEVLGLVGAVGGNFIQKRIKNCVFVFNIWSLYGRAFI